MHNAKLILDVAGLILSVAMVAIIVMIYQSLKAAKNPLDVDQDDLGEG